MAQLQHQEYGRVANADDVSLVGMQCAVWGLRNCAKFQYSDPSPATVLWSAVLD